MVQLLLDEQGPNTWKDSETARADMVLVSDGGDPSLQSSSTYAMTRLEFKGYRCGTNEDKSVVCGPVCRYEEFNRRVSV